MNYFSCRWSWFGIIITLLEDQLKRNLLLDQNRIFNTQCFSLDFLTLCFKLLILSFLLTGTMVRLWYQLVFLGRPNLKLFFFFWHESYRPLTGFIAAFQLCIKNLICQRHLYCILTALITGAFIFQVVILLVWCPKYFFSFFLLLLNFHIPGETEEEFSTRLAINLENLILKEGPETVIYSNIILLVWEMILLP